MSEPRRSRARRIALLGKKAQLLEDAALKERQRCRKLECGVARLARTLDVLFGQLAFAFLSTRTRETLAELTRQVQRLQEEVR
jgi:hypothetical protein